MISAAAVAGEGRQTITPSEGPGRKDWAPWAAGPWDMPTWGLSPVIWRKLPPHYVQPLLIQQRAPEGPKGMRVGREGSF